MENKHEQFMRQALLQAKRAFDEDEVPVGAVIVMNNQVIAKGYNQVQLLKDVTAHAEILAALRNKEVCSLAKKLRQITQI